VVTDPIRTSPLELIPTSPVLPTNATPPELRLNLTQTNSFIGRPAAQIAPNLEIVDPDGGTLPGARILIDNYTSGETLGISGQSGTNGNITGTSINWRFDAAEGVLIFTGEASNEAYQNALRLVTYSTTSTTPSTTPRTLQFSLGNLLSNPENGHFYEFVRFNSSDNITWTNSRSVASNRNYLGLTGYLATITSAREQTFIATRVDGNGWIGASDATTADDWRWVTGPEGRANNNTGTPFWSGGTRAQGGAVVNNSYAEWQTNEPNNVDNNESYGHIIGNANAYPNDSTAVGKWNDLADGGGADAFRPLGYVVEYGGLEATPLKLSGSVSVNITQPTANSVTGGNHFLWRNLNSGQNATWRLNSATLTESKFITQVQNRNWKMITAADFDGNGKDDALWRNEATGENAIWLLNGLDETSTDGSSRKFITSVAGTDWQMVTAADFNGDGRADVLWRNNVTGDNAVWFVDARSTNANGRFLTDEQFITTRVPDRNWRIVGAGDFDGDGKADIAWRNEATGDNAIWLMDGRTSKAGGERLITRVAGTDWKIATIGDFDGNGKSDLAWSNTATGQHAVWLVDAARLNGQNFFTDERLILGENNAPLIPGSNWRIEAAGDTNSDGKSDLIWRNFVSDENAVWQMNGNIAASSGRQLITNASGTVRTGDINWDIIDAHVA
jgi:FG-GAP-like repeat